MARAPSDFHSCISAIQAAAGREIHEEELEYIAEKVQGRIRRYVDSGMSSMDAARRAGQELGDEMRLAAVIEKRNHLINATVKQQMLASIDKAAPQKGLLAYLTGNAKTGLSVDSMIHGRVSSLLGPMIRDLREAGLLKVLHRRDANLEREISREMWARNEGQSVTKNPVARQAAEILSKYQEQARLMQNKAGAWIGKEENYITRQTHDAMKIGAVPFETWFNDILPKLSDRTFDGLQSVDPQSVREYLRLTYNALKSGVHDTSAPSELLGGFTGPGNMAKRVSQQRKLFFKSADDWFDYNTKYGRGGILDGAVAGIKNGGRNAAIMEMLGTNPEAMLGSVKTTLTREAASRGEDKITKDLSTNWDRKVLDVLTSKANAPENPNVAKYAGMVRAIQSMSKLGGVVLSSMPDLANTAATLRHNGVGLFESYANQITSLLPKGPEGRLIADELAAGIDGVLGDISHRLAGEGDYVAGRISRAVETFHKYNGLGYWTDSMKYGVGTMLTRNMASNADKSFTQLPKLLQQNFKRFGIGAEDWNAARATAQTVADGRSHILPGDIADEAVSRKFQAYLQDQIREALTEPDAGSRAIATAGTQAGTIPGEAIRLLMQFKTYPITYARRTIMREFARGDGPDVAGIAHLIVAMSLLGYASMSLKDIAKGRTPRGTNAKDPSDYAKVVFAAMQQGGGLGIYGDFLFGDVSRMGGGPADTLLGPTWGTFKDVTNMIGLARQWATGDKSSGRALGSTALSVGTGHIPFYNMFYTKHLLDYMVTYRLQEAMNPGYLRRYEQRVQKEQGQDFMWLAPSSAR